MAAAAAAAAAEEEEEEEEEEEVVLVLVMVAVASMTELVRADRRGAGGAYAGSGKSVTSTGAAREREGGQERPVEIKLYRKW